MASAPKMLAALKAIYEGSHDPAIEVLAGAAIGVAETEPATTLGEVAEQYHQRHHRYAEVDWRDCPQDPCPGRYRIVRPEQEADRLRKE